MYVLSEKNEIKSGRVNINDLEEEYEEQDPDYGNHVEIKTDVNKYGREFRYQDGLIGPEEPGGFLIETSSSGYGENNGFVFKVGSSTSVIDMKCPDLASRDFVKYASEYFQEFCDAITATDESGVHTGKNPETGKYYYEYCDADSLVDMYLAQCMGSNLESFGRSLYFYKDRGGIMYAGPLWDMENTFGQGAGNETKPDFDYLADKIISKDLIQIKDFRRRISRRYLNLYSKILESLINTGELLPSFRQSHRIIATALMMDTVMWPEKWKTGYGNLRWPDGTYSGIIVDYRVDWITRHKAFLDDYFLKMAKETEEEHEFGEYKDNGDGTHSRFCGICGFEEKEECSYGDGIVVERSTTSKPGSREFTCGHCGSVKQEEIPKVKQADITINTGTVTAASVKDVIEKVDAAGGTTNAVILGKKVKKISKAAFKKTGIKTVTLKTVSLKAKSVKGSLTGSTVSSFKVKVGGAKKNKKYVKQYKKIFTKKNVGRKVKVS